MAVLISDLKIFQATDMPVDFTTNPVGGGISGVQITGGSIGEVHFTMPSLGSGGGDNIQHSKFFAKNDNATDTASGVKFYMSNALDDWPALDRATIEGATVETSVKARFIGTDSVGTAFQEEIVLSATSVTTINQFDAAKMDRVELRDTTSNVLVEATEDKTIKQGATEVGIIPGPIPAVSAPGRKSATSEVDIGLESTLDDTTNLPAPGTADTPPTGIVFSRPRTLATALNVGGGGTIPAQSAQGIWSRLTVREQALTSQDIQVVPAMRILAA